MRNQCLLTLALLTLSSGFIQAGPMGTGFTYQGRLSAGTNAASGLYDLRFGLFDSPGGSGQVGGTLTNKAVQVKDGAFTLTLDFGTNAFQGDARWLEIGVCTNGGAFTTLSPRQPLTPSPLALHASEAGRAGVATTASIAGTATTAGTANTALSVAPGGVAAASLQANSVTTDKIADGTITDADISPGGLSGVSLASGTITSAKLADGAVGSAQIAVGAVGSAHLADGAVGASQLAPGAVAASLSAAGQSAVPSGGMVLSSQFNDGNLLNAGYVKLGRVELGDAWEERAGGAVSGARRLHTAVWTGSEMIVWGGYGGSYLNSGGRYDPTANNWTAVPTTGAPGGRSQHTAVWTGSEMIVWGGYNGSYLNSGGRYNPVANSWTAVPTIGVPAARTDHTAVWTGSEMIVWGGYNSASGDLNDGARYNPTVNSWMAVPTAGVPAARYGHTAVWTGTEMIVWGGWNDSVWNPLNNGGRYNPTANSWTTVPTAGAPAGRYRHTAVWTGSEMIVWGGWDDVVHFNSGGRYNPSVNRWTAVTTTGAPAAR
ncbi:MAG TPA: hypothetical protein VNT26_14920, partial [Candidatus Sulfotelmatobacter sp.]|nr:hypothetical protein [Candidatus Sulfotelmatobacter sp.]